MRRVLAGLIATLLAGSSLAGTSASHAATGPDPAAWGNRRLAAQLTFSCVNMSNLAAARRQARAGIGGIALLGTPPASSLRKQLRGVVRAAPTRVRPFVASDEEGGMVQRLRTAIYPLPSASTMGTWRPQRVRRAAEAYGLRMRGLGVRMALSPVADLKVPGAYIARLHRAFSADPDRVTRRARAWRLGMRESGVLTVLKHWPGHGSARNSHTGPARIPPLYRLERGDLVPFRAELASGTEVVMVGHLLSKGLTRGKMPTSLSPRALRYLRSMAGPDTVILTDSLSMAAASSSLELSPAQAAVRALRAGADWAMTCDARPLAAVAAVARALDEGRLSRAAAVRSAQRILALKARWGLAPRSG